MIDMQTFTGYTPHEMHPKVRDFLAQQQGLRIGDKTIVTNDKIAVENPSSGDIIGHISIAGTSHIDIAVDTARQALSGDWGVMSAEQRGILMWRLADAIEDHKHIFAELDALDNGKSVSVVRDVDVVYSAKHFRYFAGWTNKIEGKTIPVSSPHRFNYTIKQPVGVCALITPWNYPLLMASWKLAPALSAGNTILLKPAEQTSLSALYLADLALKVGFPAGVLNVLTGYGKDTGAMLSAHHGVDKVAFTGSTQTGQQIVVSSAGNIKKVSLELGGKASNIIFADADLNMAVSGAFWAGFGNNGQSCTAGARLFVHKDIYPQVLEKLAQMANDIKVGPGFSNTNYALGPVISQVQMEKILNYINMAKDQGAKVVAGGYRLGVSGYFIAPTVITDVADSMQIMCEEVFGPVLCVTPFTDEDEVIQRANNTVYGLASGFWTTDAGRCIRMAQKLRAGTIWTNCWGDTDAGSPFGGMGQSGYGREMGSEAFDLYTQTKSVWQTVTE